MPIVIVAELEQATRDPHGWRQLDVNTLAPTSWTLARLSMVGMLSSAVYLRTAETASDYATGLTVMTAAGIATIVSLVLVNRLFRHMLRLQQALASRLTAAASASATV